MASGTPAVLLVSIVLGCTSSPSTAHDAAGDRTSPTDPRAAICPSTDGGSGTVGFAQIQQIFDGNCIFCHAGGSPLDLIAAVSWQDLVGQVAPAPDSCGGTLVVPGDPAGSYLYQKLASSTPCYGAQMPLGEFLAEPLPSCVVAMVARWIEEGAPSSVVDGSADLPADASLDAPF